MADSKVAFVIKGLHKSINTHEGDESIYQSMRDKHFCTHHILLILSHLTRPKNSQKLPELADER